MRPVRTMKNRPNEELEPPRRKPLCASAYSSGFAQPECQRERFKGGEMKDAGNRKEKKSG